MSNKALDSSALFDSARSMASGFSIGTATGATVLNMGAADLNEGEPAEVVAFISGGAGGTIQLVLQDSADGSTGWATILTGPASTTNGANWTPYRMFVPPKHRQYLRVQYVVASANFTAGTLTCGLA